MLPSLRCIIGNPAAQRLLGGLGPAGAFGWIHAAKWCGEDGAAHGLHTNFLYKVSSFACFRVFARFFKSRFGPLSIKQYFTNSSTACIQFYRENYTKCKTVAIVYLFGKPGLF
jgi:hypothetical protein